MWHNLVNYSVSHGDRYVIFTWSKVWHTLLFFCFFSCFLRDLSTGLMWLNLIWCDWYYNYKCDGTYGVILFAYLTLRTMSTGVMWLDYRRNLIHDGYYVIWLQVLCDLITGVISSYCRCDISLIRSKQSHLINGMMWLDYRYVAWSQVWYE